MLSFRVEPIFSHGRCFPLHCAIPRGGKFSEKLSVTFSKSGPPRARPRPVLFRFLRLEHERDASRCGQEGTQVELECLGWAQHGLSPLSVKVGKEERSLAELLLCRLDHWREFCGLTR